MAELIILSADLLCKLFGLVAWREACSEIWTTLVALGCVKFVHKGLNRFYTVRKCVLRRLYNFFFKILVSFILFSCEFFHSVHLLGSLMDKTFCDLPDLGRRFCMFISASDPTSHSEELAQLLWDLKFGADNFPSGICLDRCSKDLY